MAELRREIGANGLLTEKQLGQLRPANTTAASVYSPASGVISAHITTIVVCNTTANTPTFRIFHDDDGSTYDETTALYFDKATTGNSTTILDTNIFMNNTSGNLAVRTSANSELTFTVYGIEYKGRQ